MVFIIHLILEHRLQYHLPPINVKSLTNSSCLCIGINVFIFVMHFWNYIEQLDRSFIYFSQQICNKLTHVFDNSLWNINALKTVYLASKVYSRMWVPQFSRQTTIFTCEYTSLTKAIMAFWLLCCHVFLCLFCSPQVARLF